MKQFACGKHTITALEGPKQLTDLMNLLKTAVQKVTIVLKELSIGVRLKFVHGKIFME